MNCPSRVDPECLPNGWNQNPDAMAAHTNNDLNGIANSRTHRDHRLHVSEPSLPSVLEPSIAEPPDPTPSRPPSKMFRFNYAETDADVVSNISGLQTPMAGSNERLDTTLTAGGSGGIQGVPRRGGRGPRGTLERLRRGLVKFGRFIGPGFLVSVAYIDPGNYATDVAAGASYQYKLLVMVLVSNVIAIFLQSLCIKLGSVTGLNLAEMCKAHCPRWLNIVLWFFAEAAIIVTDVAEVIGTAIALNLLFKLPLVAGCAISILDVLIILLFYSPKGSMRGIRIFEIFIGFLVLSVVICFCVELSLINIPNVGVLFRGFLPSSVLVEGQGLYQACGILGATVMPHSLFLGSGMVQPRLLEYDQKHGNVVAGFDNTDDDLKPKYKPSLAAIRSCLPYSIAELAISLFTFALFVNSAILIVAGASLSNNASAADATLFGIHDLLSQTLAPAAGTIFALALLLSGTSAGIICTIAGQMVSEGQLNWSLKPWVRRLMTRSLSITPSIIIAGAVGKPGLSAALEASQVALSVILPITSAPLIYFTCRKKYMMVEDGSRPEGVVSMRNNWVTAGFAVAMWLLIVIMNVASWALLKSDG